jgi:3-methylcrotonyl-CoA carboxylase alpha subunit
LVEWQIRVASGEPLPKRQNELSINGWAMEARLYAEDPANGFFPSTGTLERFRLLETIPTSTYLVDKTWVTVEASYPGDVRIETGVDEGAMVSPFYDPMIAKLICHADDRRAAALGLALVVGNTEVWPLHTNASFLHALLVNPDFRRGRVDTGFIEHHADDLIFDEEPPGWLLASAAKALVTEDKDHAFTGFRLNAAAKMQVRMGDRGKVFVGDCSRPVSHDQRRLIKLERQADGVFVTEMGTTWRFSAERHAGASAGSAADGAILSPMPGRIIAVEVAAGEAVAKGQKLVTLEAMKMEHTLTAPFDGVVAELSAEEGAQVSEGALLARVARNEG